MIRAYKQEQVLDTPSQSCTVYRCTRNGKPFLMHEFQSANQSDEFSFKIAKRLPTCPHIIKIEEQFEQNQCKYYISEYVENDLLKVILSQPNHLMPLDKALHFYAKMIDIVEELHSSKLIYRNLRPEKIRVKGDELFLYDFSMSQFVKRKERMFEVVGCVTFLAPEYFTEDGYGFEVDLWAATVILFLMLVGEYPFKIKSQDEATIKEEFNGKCKLGFSFNAAIQNNHHCQYLKGNKYLQDFFRKMFMLDYSKRLDISDIKAHKLFDGIFPNQIDRQLLQAIQQGNMEQSIFLSQLGRFPCSVEFSKDEIILDFIEHSAQSLMIQCISLIPQPVRNKVQFAILKVGMIRCQNLMDVLYGKKAPQFQIGEQQWQQIRSTTAITLIKQKLQKKKKILAMMYKSACFNVQSQSDPFFRENIPSDFNEIKIAYRNTLSQMFQLGKQRMKIKGNRRESRKLIESMVRLIILFMVNRIFDQENVMEDFNLYFSWSKKKTLEELDGWIQAQTISNLKLFMKTVTSKYL